MIIIDATDTRLGRLASFTAKEALKGEEVIIVNCNEILVTGNKKNIRDEFQEKRNKVGSVQKGPKYSKDIEKMVKRTIRGMLPNHRWGRGRVAYKKIICYSGTPGEYKESNKIELKEEKPIKSIKIKEIFNK